MASSSPASLDLNLAPKMEAKADSSIGAIPQSSSPGTLLLDPDSLSIVPVSPSPQLSPTPDDEALFAEYHRLANLFMASYTEMVERPSDGCPPGSAASSPPPPVISTSMIVSKKRKSRSAEMVRVSFLSEQDQIYFRDLVRRSRITFDSLRILIIRDELRGEGLGSFGRNRRADLKAAALMTNRGLWLNRDKRIIGSIPGIFVGDVFFFRMELCVIGLHGQVQAGIDYVPASMSSTGEPIATSIIVSGGYEDDDDGGDVLLYTGQGGRDKNLHKMCSSQKLAGGNLALERSMAYRIEIRVIRGLKFDQSPNGKVYVYDGLYNVVDCWMDAGKSGFGVFKFKLVRIEGQEEMGSAVLRAAQSLRIDSDARAKDGFFCNDISMGREKVPISMYNDLDDDQDPLHFEYLGQPIYPPSASASVKKGCECEMNCSTDCSCAALNGGEFAYDESGALVRGKPLIYECGRGCGCPASCPNRVSQKGVKTKLEVFRSKDTGWGVRSYDLIRSGTFICELSGIVLTKQQTEILSHAGECLVHPSRFPGRWAEWGDVSDVFPDYMQARNPKFPELGFSIDVSRARNAACYLSHSCSPNVFVQFVMYDQCDGEAYPHLMVFAMENIPPLRELSMDYGIVEEWVGKLTNLSESC